MSPSPSTLELPEGFAGIVRLFPLPNLVLFPHVVQALHIFEPRYRQMVEDSLAGDQLIAMARLQPGWESDYEGRPVIFPMTCLGKIVAHARLEDGRFNILLQGLRRALVVREFPPGETAFRLAEVAVMEDVYPAGGAARRSVVLRELLAMLQRLAPNAPNTQEQLDQLLGQPVSLGALTDVIGHALPLDDEFKQRLLAESNVDQRGEMLMQQLAESADKQSEGDAAFPPDFSEN